MHFSKFEMQEHEFKELKSLCLGKCVYKRGNDAIFFKTRLRENEAIEENTIRMYEL